MRSAAIVPGLAGRPVAPTGNNVMWIINSIVGTIMNGMLLPFRGMPPIIGLTVFALISGVGALYAYKWTSDQDRLAEVKRKIHAGIFEIRLFNDDMRAIFAAQRDIMRFNVSYIRLSLVPVFWMIIPFVLVVAQLQFNYGYEGLEVDEPAIVKVVLAAGQGSDVALEVPDGVRLDSPRVWIPALHEAAWRVVPEEPGDYELAVVVGGETYTKTLVASDRTVVRSPFRVSTFFDQIFFPAERPIPDGAPVEYIGISYPDATVNFLGWHTHWLIPFVIITILLAFALRKPLGVTF